MLPRLRVRSPLRPWPRAVAAGVVVVSLAAVIQANGPPRDRAHTDVTAPDGPCNVMSLDDIRRIPRHRLPTIRTYRWAAAAALSVVERDLRLPPLRGELALYSSEEAFKGALLDDGHRPLLGDASLATMIGVSTPGRICLNIHQLYPYSWSVRIAALAHEMTHVAQYQLAGGRRRGTEQWLREGMAEWVGARVLEILGQGTAASSVRAARDVLGREAERRPLPGLGDLVTVASWSRLAKQGLERPLYDISLVAAADLIDRHGLDALVEYFGRFAGSDDRPGHFRACFGEDPEAFEARLDPTWR